MKRISAVGLSLILVACGGGNATGGSDASTSGAQDASTSTGQDASVSQSDGGVQNANEMGQAVAYAMSSVVSGNGSYAWKAPFNQKAFERPLRDRLLELVMPSAHAAQCSIFNAPACNGGVRDRIFDGCTTPNGDISLTGDVMLQYSKLDCTFTAAGDTITRSPNLSFSVLGRSISIRSSANGGQLLTKTNSGYMFRVPGIERIGKIGEKEVFHFTTKTTADFVVTKSAGILSIPSGELNIVESVTGYQADLSCGSITWPITCTCPTSGTLSGSLTDASSQQHSVSVRFKSCGEGVVTVDSYPVDVTFYHCWGI